MQLFGRQDELVRLASWTDARRSFLFYGPAGIGKTRLLDELAPRFPNMLRISSCSTPQALFQALARALWKHPNAELRHRFRSADHVEAATAISLKGICLSALKSANYSLVLEHAGFTSQQFSAAVKRVAAETNTPVMFVSRSCHMEDAGYLVRHYPDRSDRRELTPFKNQQASDFANLVADEAHLRAENRPEFLAKVVELSQGNPGAIIAMVHMACTPKYRSGERIKSTPLYTDFRLARHASASSL